MINYTNILYSWKFGEELYVCIFKTILRQTEFAAYRHMICKFACGWAVIIQISPPAFIFRFLKNISYFISVHVQYIHDKSS